MSANTAGSNPAGASTVRSTTDINPVRYTAFSSDVKFDHPDIILRASDGVCFLVSSKVLARQSCVFSDLFSLPQNTHEARPVIDLPIESSTALGCTLLLISPQQPSKLVTDLVENGPTYEILQELCRVSKTYELSGMLLALSCYCSNRPILRFMLACATGFEDQAVEHSESLLRGGDFNSDDLLLLDKIAPEYASRWSEMISARAADLRQCRHLITGGQAMCDGNGNFSAQCKSGPGCRGMQQSEGSFWRLRVIAASAAMDALAWNTQDASPSFVIRQALANVIMCMVCRDRFQRTFDYCIDKTIDTSPIHI